MGIMEDILQLGEVKRLYTFPHSGNEGMEDFSSQLRAVGRSDVMLDARRTAIRDAVNVYSSVVDRISSEENMISWSSSSQRTSGRKRSNSSSTDTQPVGKKRRTNDHL